MNQDSEQNDRGRRPNRDGGPQREGRSVGRRDDAPRFTRNSDNDRPRFNRSDNSRDFNSRDDKPRFNRERSDRPFSRDNDRPRGNNDRFEGRPHRDDSESRPPRSNREHPQRDNVGSRDDKPHFNRERSDRPAPRDNDRPRGNNDRFSGGNRDENRSQNSRVERNTDRFGSERRFNDQRNDKPSFRRDDRDGDRPRFNRDDRNTERPRFNRDDNRSDGPRNDEQRSGRWQERKPEWGKPRDRSGNDDQRSGDRFSDRRNDDRPNFRRDRDNDSPRRNDGPNRFSRDERPTFKREGGFNRDNDNRNRGRSGNDDQRNGGRRNSRNDEANQSENSRFSPEQRKESGERRTGKYDKAPNYRTPSSEEKPFKPKRNTGASDFDKPKRKSPEEAGLIRLNRYIANSGVCSRREADELIARGDISVNGKVVTEMGFKVKDGDTVKYGTKVLNPERFVYVLLNKPKDFITTTDDPEERKTVMELVADAGNYRMYPVGRLDRNTTGLLLLTNDGELADRLTHPSNNIRKIYQVELDKPMTAEHFEAIQQGIELEDGPIKPDAISIVTPDAYVVGIEIHSGRNRIVRRLFEHFGYEVSKLDRTTYAGLTKKELPRGKWRFLEPKEVIKLKYFN
ncbi:pseudouridine synthase [Spirosoma sp. BT702]|uniref:Pseudouridine synthase n=1 Tax=Spirosoma profusum TaxID=2771354 RepID=A0A926Y2P6_9BACT|nr:pseudouridine synthase [Spirosoma profusum]MBD2701135.1 pseudouridine synthase [Spirosoma profusum]